MSDLIVSGVNNSTPKVPVKKNEPAPVGVEKEEPKKKSILPWVVGAAATAGVIALMVKSGKFNKAPKEVADLVEKVSSEAASSKPRNIAEIIEEPIKEVAARITPEAHEIKAKELEEVFGAATSSVPKLVESAQVTADVAARLQKFDAAEWILKKSLKPGEIEDRLNQFVSKSKKFKKLPEELKAFLKAPTEEHDLMKVAEQYTDYAQKHPGDIPPAISEFLDAVVEHVLK